MSGTTYAYVVALDRKIDREIAFEPVTLFCDRLVMSRAELDLPDLTIKKYSTGSDSHISFGESDAGLAEIMVEYALGGGTLGIITKVASHFLRHIY